MNQTLVIPSNGNSVTGILGDFSYLVVRSADNPFELSYDGANWRHATLNDNFGPIVPPPSRIYMRALSGLAATVLIEYSLVPLATQSVNQKVASTYPKSTKFAAITTNSGAPISIPSGDAGHQRKSIVFSIKTGDSTPAVNQVYICPVGSIVPFATITVATPQIFETDAPFVAYGQAGQVNDLYVGELYFA